MLYFFLGFAKGAHQRPEARPHSRQRPVAVDCALATLGFWLWARHVTSLHFGSGRRVWNRERQWLSTRIVRLAAVATTMLQRLSPAGKETMETFEITLQSVQPVDLGEPDSSPS